MVQVETCKDIALDIRAVQKIHIKISPWILCVVCVSVNYPMPTIAYIGVGSNIGDKKANCRKAIELLADTGRIIRVSSLYHTEPVGYKEQEDFINAVVSIETDLSAGELLDACFAIEGRLGRKRALRWGPRTIDLDILLYGDQIMNQQHLVLPHPLMATRKFVLAPLAEIAPAVMHPVLHKTAEQLLRELKDTSTVMKYRSDSKTP
jgi:2-amino-4-hydroxy-6-hydroxymethyldihydropteridine diphosphokinase